MASLPASLFLDEDVSVVVAAILAARGFMVVTVRDRQRLGRSDTEQLAYAAESHSVLLTHNRADFERLHRDWLHGGKSHSGVLVARRRPAGELAARVGRILSRLSADELCNQLLYI